MPRDPRLTPYTPDEKRVCDYLQSIVPEIGCGDDPIGFLLASHGALRHVRARTLKQAAAALSMSKQQILLIAGEMTAQELRTVRAVLDNRARTILDLAKMGE